MFEQILETTRQVAHATSQAIAATIRNIREIAVQVPQYVMRAIRAVPDALSVGLEAGLALGRFFLTHIPEMFRFFGRCLRFIGNLIFEIIRDFPRFIRACFELMGTILRNFSHIMRISFEFVKWMTRATVNALISLARNIVNVTSTALEINIGIVVESFQLIYEVIFPNCD